MLIRVRLYLDGVGDDGQSFTCIINSSPQLDHLSPQLPDKELKLYRMIGLLPPFGLTITAVAEVRAVQMTD
jgi:hypothetical protein